MILINKNLVELIIVILAICGFLVAKHIRNHKIKNTPLTCPVMFDCHTVVHSDYASFFGVPVEFLGMFYYVFTALVHLSILLLPSILLLSYGNLVIISLFSLALIGFLFSAYLIAVQIFILKKGCSWCIVSAFICFIIFVLSAFNYDISVITKIFG